MISDQSLIYIYISFLTRRFELLQSDNKSEDIGEGRNKDLRSRGLCLVPISSTFPVTHETNVDLWTPTFGSTFR